MLDHTLEFVVVVGPLLFAIGVEVVSENIRKHRFWKWGVMAFGLALSALTYWQIGRQEKNATIDRDKAVERVASQTAAQVAQSLTPQYEALRREDDELYKKLGESDYVARLRKNERIRSELDALNIDVSGFKRVTGYLINDTDNSYDTRIGFAHGQDEKEALLKEKNHQHQLNVEKVDNDYQSRIRPRMIALFRATLIQLDGKAASDDTILIKQFSLFGAVGIDSQMLSLKNLVNQLKP